MQREAQRRLLAAKSAYEAAVDRAVELQRQHVGRDEMAAANLEVWRAQQALAAAQGTAKW